jgi:excisionase family DNA binding protein
MTDHGPIDPERMYTIKELATIFAVSERTVSRWLDTKKLKAYVLGGSIRIYGKDIIVAAQAARERVKKTPSGPRTPGRARNRD